jgi:frataxin-like iron-binding protein CyaY
MTKNDFEIASYGLLNENKKILICLRIPNSGNNRHYFFIENKSDFDDLISSCNPSDSLTVFKSFNELCIGLITIDFINKSLQLISEKESLQEIIILEGSYQEFKRKGYSEWQDVESISEFKEVLTESFGKNVSIILEPEFWNTEDTFHLYIPDKNGISKPGNAY